jgi:hypothetical protein
MGSEIGWPSVSALTADDGSGTTVLPGGSLDTRIGTIGRDVQETACEWARKVHGILT